MIHAIEQQGGWPLYKQNPLPSSRVAVEKGLSAASTAHGKLTGPAVPVSAGVQKTVRFSGGLARWGLDASVHTFQKINEVFLWGFLAQDIIGLWLPRVGTSLRVGRVPYDPATDPKAKNQPFHQQMGQWIKGNVRGLNWVNFGEETKREIATGPGLLFLPTLFFLGNQIVGNPAKEMSYNSLKTMGEGFKEHLAKRPGKMDRARFEAEVRDYLGKIFVDDRLAEGMKPHLKEWTHAWTDEMLKQASGSPWERMKRNFRKTPLHTQAERLHEMIRGFNREHRALAYADNAVIRDDNPLHHANQTWIAYRPDAYRRAITENAGKTGASESLKTLVAQKDLHSLTEDLSRFGGFVRHVWERYEGRNGAHSIADVAGKSMQELVTKKFLLMGVTTALAACYLTRLAFWAQNSSSYQAVRLLQPEKAHSAAPDKTSETRTDAGTHAPVARQLPGNPPASASPFMIAPAHASIPTAYRPEYRYGYTPDRLKSPSDRRNA